MTVFTAQFPGSSIRSFVPFFASESVEKEEKIMIIHGNKRRRRDRGRRSFHAFLNAWNFFPSYIAFFTLEPGMGIVLLGINERQFGTKIP